MSDNTVHFSINQGREFIVQSFISCGCSDAQANAVADNMIMAERDGSHSHGLFRLPGYLTSIKSGKIKTHPKPQIKTSRAIIIVDGDHSMAPYAYSLSRDALIEAAKENGIALLAMRETYHLAALWIETAYIAEQGLCALACTSYLPSVAPCGVSQIFGTNPMSFAWPRKGKFPLVFDQASAVMARGDIMIADREGRELPHGVGVNSNGEPTTSPAEILKGAQLAFGGYKGANIALMIELLAGPLIGETTSLGAKNQDNQDGGPPRGGEFIIAVDPSKFDNNELNNSRAEDMFNQIIKAGGRIPGERKLKYREQTEKNGFNIPKSIYDKVIALTKNS